MICFFESKLQTRQRMQQKHQVIIINSLEHFAKKKLEKIKHAKMLRDPYLKRFFPLDSQ